MSFADTFKALSNPVRREILQMLKKGRMSAGEIASHFDITSATISNHLNVLKKAGLVGRKEKLYLLKRLEYICGRRNYGMASAAKKGR